MSNDYTAEGWRRAAVDLARQKMELERRARIAAEREAELLAALRELRDAEWMVTPYWCGPGERERLNDRIDQIIDPGSV